MDAVKGPRLVDLLRLQKSLEVALFKNASAGPNPLWVLYHGVRQASARTELDILARLQFLEGAFMQNERKELKWSRGTPRASLKKATKAIQDIAKNKSKDKDKKKEKDTEKKDTERFRLSDEFYLYWLGDQDTGFFRDIKMRMAPILKGRTTEPEDVMQMALMGMNASGETFYYNEEGEKVPLTRMFQAFGYRCRHQIPLITSGEKTPYDYSPHIAKWAIRKALNILKAEKREEAQREEAWGKPLEDIETEEGDVITQEPSSGVDESLGLAGYAPGVSEAMAPQSRAWAMSTAIFHQDTKGAKAVRDWLKNVLFRKKDQKSSVMRHMFDMMQEGTWDVADLRAQTTPNAPSRNFEAPAVEFKREKGKELARTRTFNEELARRVEKELGKPMKPNAKGQYTAINAAREAGFAMIQEALKDLSRQGTKDLSEEEDRLEKSLERIRHSGLKSEEDKEELKEQRLNIQIAKAALEQAESSLKELETEVTRNIRLSPRSQQVIQSSQAELDLARGELDTMERNLEVVQEEVKRKKKVPKALQNAVEKTRQDFQDAMRDSQATLDQIPPAGVFHPDTSGWLESIRDDSKTLYLDALGKKEDYDKALAAAEKGATVPKKLQTALKAAEDDVAKAREEVKKWEKLVKDTLDKANAPKGLRESLTEAQKGVEKAKKELEHQKQVFEFHLKGTKKKKLTKKDLETISSLENRLKAVKAKKGLREMIDDMDLTSMGFGRLRRAAIRLANSNPALRPHILQILRQAGVHPIRKARSNNNLLIQVKKDIDNASHPGDLGGVFRILDDLNKKVSKNHPLRKELDALIALADKKEADSSKGFWG